MERPPESKKLNRKGSKNNRKVCECSLECDQYVPAPIPDKLVVQAWTRRDVSQLKLSLDGKVLLFKVREKKNMQVVAQLNNQDKSLKVVGLQLNAQDGS